MGGMGLVAQWLCDISVRGRVNPRLEILRRPSLHRRMRCWMSVFACCESGRRPSRECSPGVIPTPSPHCLLIASMEDVA